MGLLDWGPGEPLSHPGSLVCAQTAVGALLPDPSQPSLWLTPKGSRNAHTSVLGSRLGFEGAGSRLLPGTDKTRPTQTADGRCPWTGKAFQPPSQKVILPSKCAAYCTRVCVHVCVYVCMAWGKKQVGAHLAHE